MEAVVQRPHKDNIMTNGVDKIGFKEISLMQSERR